jgi:curved DNA-binding protein CbpA
MALQHHPDSGGSLEEMRRVNEAYQLLKELYRQPEPPANPSHESH